MMSAARPTRRWDPIITALLGNGSKKISIARGEHTPDSPTAAPRPAIYSLQIIIVYANGHEASIPIPVELVNTLTRFLEGNLDIPPQGVFVSREDRHYLLLDNKNRELTLSYEVKKYRILVRLSEKEVKDIVCFARIKKLLSDGATPSARQENFKNKVMLWTQVIVAERFKTTHELGKCSCEGAVDGWPCNLASTRSITDNAVDQFHFDLKFKREFTDKVIDIVKTPEYFANVLMAITSLSQKLGLQLSFTGPAAELFTGVTEDMDYYLLVNNLI